MNSEGSVDMFSELPDSLVVQILSFLDLKEAATTSVLSKRWEFLWTELPNLELLDTSGDIDKIRKFVSWVNRTLSVRTVNYLEKLDVSFIYYKAFSSDVDAWIQFAAENKVKTLNLHLYCFNDVYTPPEAMYCCPSLTTLSVIGCNMEYSKRKIEWRSLIDLHLHFVLVDELLLDEILSSCPLLYTLFLEKCRGFDRLEVNSPSVHILKIVDCECEKDAPPLKISAPYIYTLDISLPEAGRKVQLEDKKISSLVRVEIDFQGLPWASSGVEVMYDAKKLLESLTHVKELYVGLHFVQIISMTLLVGVTLPQSKREHLVVTADIECQMSTTYGIIGLLESSPNLETLVIKGPTPKWYYGIQDPAEGRDLDCDLSHLKTISFINFADPNGEPMLTLARILLKKAPSLENMDVVVDVAKDSNFIRIGEELQLCPRASINAEIVIKKHSR